MPVGHTYYSIDVSGINNVGTIKVAEKEDGKPVYVDVDGTSYTQKLKRTRFKKVADFSQTWSSGESSGVNIFGLDVRDWELVMLVISADAPFEITTTTAQFFTLDGSYLGEHTLGSAEGENVGLWIGRLNPDRSDQAVCIDTFDLPFGTGSVDIQIDYITNSGEMDINVHIEVFLISTDDYDLMDSSRRKPGVPLPE